jgi:hypothetical protein
MGQNNNGINWRNINGIRIVVAAFGILCGLTGIIAGYFEIRQGSISPDGFVISTIGPGHVMADDFTYFAVTVIPDILITGILAVIVSCLVIIWSVGYTHKKKGVYTLPVLFIIQTLVGGGWIIDLAVITCILAFLINKPLNWWCLHIPVKLRVWFVKLFPFSLIAYTIISLSMLALTVTGTDNESFIKPMEILAAIMLIPMILIILGGLSINTQRQENTDSEFLSAQTK